jgi:hypothetical protein
MNSIEHPTSNKEFPTSNEINSQLNFVIGYSVFDIGYSSLKLLEMGRTGSPRDPFRDYLLHAPLITMFRLCQKVRKD